MIYRNNKNIGEWNVFTLNNKYERQPGIRSDLSTTNYSLRVLYCAFTAALKIDLEFHFNLGWYTDLRG